MFIIQTMPLVKIEGLFDYFSNQKLKPGSLVSVKMNKSEVRAIVKKSIPLKEHKIEVKESQFKLKPISKILTKYPVLTDKQMKLAIFVSQFYLAPLGICLKLFLPKSVLRNQNIEELHLDFKEQEIKEFQKPILLWNKNRIEYYKKNIRSQTLILVPEISMIEQYKNMADAVFHSRLNQKKELEIWRKTAAGEINTIVGTRRALFLPFKDLNLIIIDNEENPGYKSWDMQPKYHTKTLALKLAQINNSKTILGTSFPSIESFYFSSQNKYKITKEEQEQNKVKIIDLRQEIKKGNFSVLSDELEKEIKQSEQSILFINRKGTARAMVCRDCGYTIKCPYCSAPMVYYKETKLICKHCSKEIKMPSLCPKCGSRRMKELGPGVEKVVQSVQKLGKTVSLDSTKKQQKQILKDFKNKKYKILVTTQLPENIKVPLSANVIADSIINLPEYRSQYNFFRIIQKLRENSKKTLIQTYNPEIKIFNSIKNNKTEEFFKKEIETRKALFYPPFSKIIKLSLTKTDRHKAKEEATELKQKIEKYLKQAEISGPNPGFVEKKKNKYIWQIIIKIKTEDYKKARFLKTLASNWDIDVEPASLL